MSQMETSGSRPHVFAAVIHSERAAHGGDHIRRHLHSEVVQQLKMSSGGDPLAAIKCAFSCLVAYPQSREVRTQPPPATMAWA